MRNAEASLEGIHKGLQSDIDKDLADELENKGAHL